MILNSLATVSQPLTGDKIRMEKICYSSLYSQYLKHMSDCQRGKVLIQFQNDVKRLGISFPVLFLIRTKKGLDIQAN